MNNIIYIKKDPILVELDDSVDKKSAKMTHPIKWITGGGGNHIYVAGLEVPRVTRWHTSSCIFRLTF